MKSATGLPKQLSIDSVLEMVREKLALSSEAEWELLEEIRSHLEEAVENEKAAGVDEEIALLKAAEAFGIDESTADLQTVHAEWEILHVLLMCIVPVFCTLILRWLIFAAEGTAGGWQPMFSRPTIVAIALFTLILPIIQFRKWPYVTVGWVCFWAISLVFLAFPAIYIE